MKKPQQGIVAPDRGSDTERYGLILEYDKHTNTATVILPKYGTDDPGEIYTNVLCPTEIGVQSLAPEMGRPCFVSFMRSTNTPIISSFFNHDFEEVDERRHDAVQNTVPRFMMEL